MSSIIILPLFGALISMLVKGSEKDISKNVVFELSFLDELWQAENWGFDEETSQTRKEISFELNKCISFLDCL